MIQTFRGLRDRVLRVLDESAAGSDAASTTRMLVDDALNYAHQQRCTEFPWNFMLWGGEATLTTVTGQVLYPLHQEFHRPLWFWNETAQCWLEDVPSGQTPERYTSTSGSARRFFFSGMSAVARQPSTTGVVRLVSSDATDTGTSCQVVVKGELADGSIIAEILTPSGTTPVESSYEFRRILAVTKESEWTGTLTLTDSAGNTLLTLNPYEMGRKYLQIELVETPTSAETIRYRFYRQPLVLVNDYDQPEIPAPHAQLLVWDTLVQLSAYLTELAPEKLGTWKGLQQEAQLAFYQAYANEQQSQHAAVRYIRAASETIEYPYTHL